MSKRTVWLLALFTCCSCLAFAQGPPGGIPTINIIPNGPVLSSPSDIVAVYEASVGMWITRLQGYAFEIFWALAFVDFAWFGVQGMLNYRDQLSLLGLLASKKLLSTGMFLAFLMNADTWVPMIVNVFPILGVKASGIPSILPSELLKTGVVIAGTLLADSVKAAGTLDLAVSAAYIIAALGIMISFTWLTGTFLVAKIQTVLAIGIGYILLALGGAQITRSWVEKYYSFAVSAGIHLMTMYMLIGVGMVASQNWVNQVNNLSFSSLNVDTAWSILAGSMLYVMVCWHVSKLTSGILGGAPSLTGSDMLAIAGAGASAALAAARLIPGVGNVVSGVSSAGNAVGGAVAAASSSGPAAAAPSPASAPGHASAGASSQGYAHASAPRS